MNAVVAFEIKSRVFHESPDFTGEQHFREHGAIVVCGFFRSPVTYGERHASSLFVRVRKFQA